jgi:hypothetical protein
MALQVPAFEGQVPRAHAKEAELGLATASGQYQRSHIVIALSGAVVGRTPAVAGRLDDLTKSLESDTGQRFDRKHPDTFRCTPVPIFLHARLL